MTWQPLLDAKRIVPHETSADEIAGLRAVIDRDLKDAALKGLSIDRRFATTYNAVIQIATMAIACAGFRVSSRPGHHKSSIAAIVPALGESSSSMADYFEICRRKRNAVDYDRANVITKTELNELVMKAEQFKDAVEAWIAERHPRFSSASAGRGRPASPAA